MDFNFAKLVITIELETDTPDPCALYSSRKGFAAAFRQVVDCRCIRCETCPLIATCPYYQTFAQAVSADPLAAKHHQKPPLPFVFDVPRVPPSPNSGTLLEVGLVLVGSAINHIDFYMAAFSLLLQQDGPSGRIDASIRRVDSVDYMGNRHLLEEREGKWASGGLPLLSVKGLCKTVMLPMDWITITIETPMRILHDGKPLRELSFSVIIRALMRRLSSMAYYYGGVEADYDFKWLVQSSNAVVTAQKSFRWVEWGRGLSGVIGSGTFTGEMGEFHPFLLAGEYLHVGKGAPFGLGRFRVERIV
jgi:hypothetical protein